MLETIASNNGLSLYLESLIKGKAFTPRSWLYDGYEGKSVKKEPDEILADWMDILSSLEQGGNYEQEVFQFDTSQKEKWGPQGGVAPIADLMDIVTEGYSQAEAAAPAVFESREWKLCRDHVGRVLATVTGGALRPASYQSVVDDMRARDTIDSNSGWPLFTKRKLPEVIASSIRDAEDGTWKNYPAIALFRNYNCKTRLVWMFPMSANLVEGSFFQPLQSAIISSKIRPHEVAPWVGFEECRKLVSQVYADTDGHTYDSQSRLLSLAASDFSSTDAHFTKAHTEQVYECIKHCFQKRYWDALHESMMHLHEIPLIIGPDSMLTGDHGVSSGSNWTNFIETIFDMILGEYVDTLGHSLLDDKDPEKYHGSAVWHARCLYAIGDDMAWLCDWYNPAFADALQSIGEDVGQVIKAEKTTNDPNKVKSLQRLFQRGYNRPDGLVRAVYPTVRALKSLVYPERMHKARDWSSDMFCARAFMIMENCVDHPLFEEFVRFVCAGSSDLPKFARKKRKQLDKILGKTKLLPGFNPTYNQERRDSSLADFESIRIARSL